jgi:carbon monoxide dehydrogenase subunit G
LRPVVIDLERTLPGPPDVVWQLITDWENQGSWMREASDFVVTSPHREGVGVEAMATVRVGGIKTRDPTRVDAWEPKRRLGIEHRGWVQGRGDLYLEPADGGTRLRWREELHPPWGLAGALGLRAYRPMLARTFRRDLGLLAELVRKRSEIA